MYLLSRENTFNFTLQSFSHSFEDPKKFRTRIALQLFTYRCHYSDNSPCVIHNARTMRGPPEQQTQSLYCSVLTKCWNLLYAIRWDPSLILYGQYQCDFYVCTIAAIFVNRSRPLGTYSTFFLYRDNGKTVA